MNFSRACVPWLPGFSSDTLQDHGADGQNPEYGANGQSSLDHQREDSTLFFKPPPGCEISFTNEELATLNIYSSLPENVPLSLMGMPAQVSEEDTPGQSQPEERRLTLTQFDLSNKVRVKFKLRLQK